MLVIFMKKLATDTSAEGISRIKTILAQNNIRFEIATARGRTGSDRDVQTGLRSNPVAYNLVRDPMFIYTVYVNRKDFTRAQQLVFGS
jgi:hypothetical protein